MGDDEALDDGLVEVQGVLGRGGEGEDEAGEGAGLQGVGEGEGGGLAEVRGLGLAEDGFDGAEVDAGVDADDGAAFPVGGGGADEEGGDVVFFGTAAGALGWVSEGPVGMVERRALCWDRVVVDPQSSWDVTQPSTRHFMLAW